MILRRREKTRPLEWSLSLLAVGLVLMTVLASVPWYGIPLYFLLGGAGLIAVARDAEPHSPNWGLLTWGSVGGLVGQNLLNLELGIAARWPLLPLLWGAALAFLLAALLADYRRGRLMAIVVSLLAAVTAGFLSYYFLAAVLRAFGVFR